MTETSPQPYREERGPSAAHVPGASLTPEAIYRAELPYVWHSLRRLGVRGADIDDLTQEVFLRAFRSLGQYDPTRPLRPWLFSIAYRLAADHRNLSRHRYEVAEDQDAVDPAPGPDASVEVSQAKALTLRALDAVSLERRAVFVLYELNGHTMPELATALDIPLNTAYSRLRLARAEFAEAVQRLSRQPKKGEAHGA